MGRTMAALAAFPSAEEAPESPLISAAVLARLASNEAHEPPAAKLLGPLGAFTAHSATCVSALVSALGAAGLLSLHACQQLRTGTQLASCLRCRNSLAGSLTWCLRVVPTLLKRCPSCSNRR